jgi:hypothetical protein
MTRKATSSPEPQLPPVIEDQLHDHESKPNGADPETSPSPGEVELDEFAQYAVETVVTSHVGDVAFCHVGPPNKLHFIRASLEPRMYRDLHFITIEEENKKRSYLVHGALIGLPEFDGRTKVARTCPWVNEFGAIGFWLVSILNDENSWVRSALTVIEAAKSEWICAFPVKRAGQYSIVRSQRDRGEPKWPALSFPGWMKLAFPEDMRINSPDHPIAKLLRGE